jgi:hypothetical protein
MPIVVVMQMDNGESRVPLQMILWLLPTEGIEHWNPLTSIQLHLKTDSLWFPQWPISAMIWSCGMDPGFAAGEQLQQVHNPNLKGISQQQFFRPEKGGSSDV